MPLQPELKLSGFPECDGGDVLIVLAPGKTFILHSVMLKRHSSFFAKELTLENAAHLKRGTGIKIRYRFDLVQRPGPEEKGPGKLSRTDINENAQPLNLHYIARPDLHAGRIPNPIYAHYHNLFSLLYGLPLILSSNIGTLVLEIDGLIDIAEYLGSVHVISSAIEAALLRQRQVLFQSVAAAPTAWIDVAVRGRMALVAEEAVRHLIGQWGAIPQRDKDALPSSVGSLVKLKVRALDARKMAVEMAILNYHPRKLEIERGSFEPANRSAYGANVYVWVTLCMFRAWFGGELISGSGRNAPDGGWALYTRLATKDFLPKELMNRMLESQNFHMNSRAKGIVARDLDEMRRDVASLARPLLENKSNLDAGKYPQKYLICGEVSKGEILRMMPVVPRVEAAVEAWGDGEFFPEGKVRGRSESVDEEDME